MQSVTACLHCCHTLNSRREKDMQRMLPKNADLQEKYLSFKLVVAMVSLLELEANYGSF